jgi:hypothetical protein
MLPLANAPAKCIVHLAGVVRDANLAGAGLMALHPHVALVLDRHAAEALRALAILRADDLTGLLQLEAGERLAGVPGAAHEAVLAVDADLRRIVGQRLAGVAVSVSVSVSVSLVAIAVSLVTVSVSVAVSLVAVSVSVAVSLVAVAISLVAIAISLVAVAIPLVAITITVTGVAITVTGVAITIAGRGLGGVAGVGWSVVSTSDEEREGGQSQESK